MKCIWELLLLVLCYHFGQWVLYLQDWTVIRALQCWSIADASLSPIVAQILSLHKVNCISLFRLGLRLLFFISQHSTSFLTPLCGLLSDPVYELMLYSWFHNAELFNRKESSFVYIISLKMACFVSLSNLLLSSSNFLYTLNSSNLSWRQK